ncbi:WD40-repeat-containing domain protein [Powellomyces hirtus]|nr:WD40-repeat-containing domain protein [Powellomyces hirtus]
MSSTTTTQSVSTYLAASDKHFCYRHRPGNSKAVTNSSSPLSQRLEALSAKDKETVSQIWNLFATAPRPLRPLILDGLLDNCCLPQLSYMAGALGPLLRVDFISNAPTEIAIGILQYLDAKSLCHAARTCSSWRKLADDDIIWHRMCEQHIDRKCKKCGWGLPLLDNKRRNHLLGKRSSSARRAEDTQSRIDGGSNDLAVKRMKVGPPEEATAVPTAATTPIPRTDEVATRRPCKRPWKEIYAERLVVERNWRSGTFARTELLGHTDSVMCLHYDESKSLLVTGSYDYTIRVWDTDTMQCIKVLTGHTRCVRGIQMDDNKMVSGSMDRTLRIWNLKTFQCIRILEGHAAGVVCLHFNDKMLASGSVDGTIRVWNLGAGCCFSLAGHRDWVNKVQILDKKRLISCSDDSSIKLWDLETRAELRSFNGHVGQIQGMQAFIPHSAPRVDGITLPGGILISGSLDNTIKIWCLETGAEIKTLFGHVEGVWCAAVDSLRIISGGQDRKVIVWDIERGQKMYELTGHGGAVNCCQMTDTKVLTGGEDGAIRIWDFLPDTSFMSRPVA